MIKLLAFIYRCTGWFCPLVYKYQHKHLMTMLDHIAADYELGSDTLDSLVSVEIGMWQAHHGFTRTHKQAWSGK